MFNDEFFPTSPSLAEQMLLPYRERIKNGATILDPSAGSGSLLRAAARLGAKEKQLFAIEIQPELTAILKEGKFRLIGDDFFKFESRYLFDIIVMNPPFSNGEEHLLQAWEVLREGDIVCLLNSETIRNPYSEKRKLLRRLIEENGSVEELGQVFKGAERRTDVEVSLVRLNKRQEQPLFEFNAPDKRTRTYQGEREAVDLESQVAKSDMIEAFVSSYQQVGQAYEKFITARNELDFYTRSIVSRHFKFKPEDARPSLSHILDLRERQRAQNIAEYNAYMDAVKFEAWNQVFDCTKIKEILTASVREEFNKFQQDAGCIEFSETNIWAFFEMLIRNRTPNMRRCVVEVFDRLTSYDKKNKIHVEGWKTNSAYKVNEKVILPYFVEFEWERFTTCYRNVDRLRDIDRVMCMLSGKKFEEVLTIELALKIRFDELKNIQPGGNFDKATKSEFFDLKFFKKGTLHMKFLDPFLWQEFNLQAAKGKNWLPDGD